MTTSENKTPVPQDTAQGTTSRRKFLAGAAVATAAAGTVAMPQVSRAQTITWRFQSTWPQRDIFHENASDYARMVTQMSGGRLNLELLPAGAVVGALQMQDAVIAGALDGGHGVTAYWYGKHKAYSLFGTPPAYGWDAHQFLAWFYYGGGEDLYKELVNNILGLDLVGYLTGPMPTQPLGWFRQPISGVNDLKDLKYRTVGLAADLKNEMGAAVTIMGGPDIVPGLDRGLLDAAEFNNPSSDRLLGFSDVTKHWYLQSYHQDAECFEIILNKTKVEALPEELQAILRFAAYSVSSDMYWKAMKRYPEDFAWLENEGGVTMHITPSDILEAQLAAWDKVIERSSADPNTGEFFGRVIASQKEFCEKTVGWYLKNQAPKQPAFDHFFGA
jgi:TRAP-type mannitol/chloroaromatic compound transport system substrate-binding protein